jgi:hypothetical protein
MSLRLLLTLTATATLAAGDAATGWWPPFVPDVPPPAPQAPAAGEQLVIDGAECAGISGFRADWDRPIPLAADGATKVIDKGQFGKAPAAVWNDPAKPGAIACDAVHRSLLVRFPGAAERIAAALGAGKTVVRAELALEYKGVEVFAPGYADPAGMSFLGDQWVKQDPHWHAVAWALKQPWISDREVGPTWNAFINGAGYWSAFGAREAGKDRVAAAFGPAPLSKDVPEGRLDITASLSDPAFGADVGTRLRRLADCGFLVRKWEVYDASFWRGGYEWGTGTGPRAFLLGAPKLVLTLAAGKAAAITLPPAADVRALAKELAGGKGGKPTAVFADAAQFNAWAAKQGRVQPKGMEDATWQRLQELWAQDDKRHGFPATYEEYVKWVDGMLACAPRRWSGFDAAEVGAIGIRDREALPAPLVEHLRLYWWSWLMPDREIGGLVQGYIGGKEAAEYYARTKDWRGNFSVYRTYCRAMGTMNFNHWASAGTLFGGALLESPRLIGEGEAGLRDWPLKMWTWFDGTSQETLDHYYLSHSLATQLPFACYSPTVEQRLMGQAILAKTVGELCSTYHPRLKRFSSSSGRTGVAYPLFIQDGVSTIMHTVMPGGALTDIGRKTVGDGMPVIGHDFSPALAANLALDAPWAPAWYGAMVAAKPVPYQSTATYKMWGGYAQTPLWKRSFQGRHYGVGSIDLAQNETVPFLVHWRRAEQEVTASEELAMLIGRFGVNRTELLDSIWHDSKQRNPNGTVGNQGGPLHSVQHRNRLVVLSSPYKGLLHGDKSRGVPAEITSIQTTLGLITLHQGWELLLDGKPVQPPVMAKAGQRLVIRDGVAYVGIIALPGTDLGRDAEVEIVADGVSTEMQGGGKLAEALRINAYNYRGAALPKDQWSSERIDDAWGGFCIQAGDASEWKDAAAFDAQLAKGQVKTAWDAAKRRLDVSWALGGDILACAFVPSAPIGQPTTQSMPERTINGRWLYLEPGLERSCDLSAMGTSGRFEKNGAIFEGTPGRMGSLLTDPANGIVEAWNPYPDPGLIALTLPGGARIDPVGKVGITRLTAFLKQNRVAIDGAVPAPGRATVAVLSGFPAGVLVELNGRKAVTAAGEIDGRPVVFVALDGKPLADPAKLIEELRARRAAAEAARGIDPAQTRIAAWHLARAFPAEPAKALATVFAPERGAVDLTASYPGGIDGKPVAWVKRDAKAPFGTDIVDLGGGDNRVAYAFTTLVSDQDREVRFCAGSDDGLAVWVNGAEVWRHDTFRACAPDEDEFPVMLKKGANTVLLKVTQGGGGWAFCLRVADRFGYPFASGVSVAP